MNTRRRILVARTDRLGDVLLTLPTLEYLRRCLPGQGIDFYCRQDLHELLRPHLESLQIGLVDGVGDWTAYEAALFLFAPFREVWAAWRAGVAKRFGARSKWHSWLGFNQGLAQQRSEGIKAEAIYNLELAQWMVRTLTGDAPQLGEFRICLEGSALSETAAQAALNEIGVSEPFIVVHPGMGGSALNLSAAGYARIMAQWPKATVVVSVGPSPYDAPVAEDLLRLLTGARRLPRVSLAVLREIFRKADLVIAPSTGPLHLAHYVGTDTLGIFSPVRAQRSERWAPWGGCGFSRLLSPAPPCPGTRACLGERCERHPCLETLVGETLPSGWADGLMLES